MAMRLIDGDGSYTLNASNNTGYSLCFGGGTISCVDEMGHIIAKFFADEAPTITPESLVRHGRWLYSKIRMEQVPICSECRRGTGVSYEYDYCPNCGAIMDLE